MLESLIKYSEIEKRPWIMALWALLISSVGVLFSVQLSYKISVSGNMVDLTGIFSVLFTIVPSVYFLTVFIKKSEKLDEKDISMHYDKGFWERHDKDIIIFLFFFFGLTFSYAFWAFILPPETFQLQLMKIQDIRALAGNVLGVAEGSVLEGSAGAGSLAGFTQVLMNNMQVTAFAFIFSLLFGAGAVFIVVWNASILGIYIGRLSETLLHIPGVSLSFLPHGIPEIAAYLMAGLSGGIISAAVLRGHKKDVIMKVVEDALKLLGMAIAFIFLAALIETMDILTRIVAIFIFYTIFIYIITVALSPQGGKRRRF